MPGAARERTWKSSTLARATLRLLVSCGIVVVVTAVFLFLVEGVASVVVAARGGRGLVLRERAHTEFDAELGWVNERRVRIDDLYGPGLYLETNSQGFRNRQDFPRAVPAKKLRLVCSGDSFTLGYGVKNDDAWCELLADKDSRFETVNMGQGGYGADQAYLWYMRDGLRLDHDVAIFAAIAGDFGRMMASTFFGYPKPVLSVRNGKPVLVKKSSRLGFVMRGLGQRLEGLTRLRSVELWRSLRSLPENAGDAPAMSPDEGKQLATAIFEDLRNITASRGTTLIVVLLPILEDYRPGEADEWESFLQDELRKRSIPFLDLVAALRKEPEALVRLFFRGHYSELGNRWVADRLYDALLGLQPVRERLDRVGPPARPILPLAPLDAPVSGRPIPLRGARVQPSTMGEFAAFALDGSRATRWHSGSVQTGREELLVDLGRSTAVRQVKLELGEWRYDYGRTLALDVGNDENHLDEVLRVEGDQAIVDDLDGSGAAQVLTVPAAISARYLRIRQLAHTEENFWSVAEIEVYGND